MHQNKPKLIVICGTTASGKTALGVEIAKKYNGELINADSRQVYRYMDIGTNKELDCSSPGNPISGVTRISDFRVMSIPIHLIDIVDPDERYTVYQFKIDAAAAIEDIASRGKLPILVGGTGLWIDSLIYNYQLPKKSVEDFSTDERFASSLEMTLEEQVAELLRVDPDAEYAVDLKNPRRVVRALQVYYETGVPFTKQPKLGEPAYEILKIAPMVDMGALERKIADRVVQMFDEGLVDEVASLVHQYGWEHEAMTGIGYREFRQVIGDLWHAPSPEEIKEIKQKIMLRTRQYAKRQMTWFKRDQGIFWANNLNGAIELVEAFIGLE